MKKWIGILTITFFAQLGCDGSESGHQPLGNEGALAEPLTFVQDILPLVQQRCSLCHSPGAGLPVWEDYNTLFASRDLVRFRVFEDQSMPRGNATGMTDEERMIMAQWIDEGAVFE